MPALKLANVYLWKCWRDTRSTFLVLLVAILLMGAFGALVTLDPFGWLAAKSEEVRGLWRISVDALLPTVLGVIPVAGFVLGALGVGLEFENGTADFLFTRPRTRHYLLWTSWAVGAMQMIALVLVSFLLLFLRTTSVRGVETLNAALRLAAGFVTIALFVYSLTYMTTTVARNSRNGIGLAILAMSVYGGLVVWMRLWHKVQLPIFFDLYDRWYRAGPNFLPAVGGWLAVTLALTFIAQFAFERAEI